MSKLLKDQIDLKSIKKLAFLIKQQLGEFDVYAFESVALTEAWDGLSLKQRIRTLANALQTGLLEAKAADYESFLAILKPVSVEFSGLFHFVFSDFVECYGLEHFELSMQALALFTKNSTAEYAIRAFLRREPERTKQQMLTWANSDNEQLRRLASEGVRPKLPWSFHLPWIAQNPDWVKPIIEKLKSDSSLYVRKSVANLLNDLSKTQADWVMRLFVEWLGDGSKSILNSELSDETRWIIKHALRTLLKQGDPQALALIGYPPIEHVTLTNWQLEKQVVLGDKLNFGFELYSSESKKPLGLLRVEYAVYFLRKRAQPYRKVFKIAEADYALFEKVFSKAHNFKPINTRTYQAGAHKIELIVNGKVVHKAQFTLVDG